jgi:hypothetical protein
MGRTEGLCPTSNSGGISPLENYAGEDFMIKLAIAVALVIGSAATAWAQLYGSPSGLYGGGYGNGSNPNSHTISPYTTQSGTYVGSHHSTNPNNTQLDNYSTRGNVNPYTGQIGTRSPRW